MEILGLGIEKNKRDDFNLEMLLMVIIYEFFYV